jgi:hypothetical protein
LFRQVFAVAVLASLPALAACTSGSSPAQSSSGLVPLAVTPDKGCGSAGHVKVKPCPIRLTSHTQSGIVVTVSGPGVVNSYLGQINSCYSGKLCYFVEREGSSQTQWRFTPGTVCGGAEVEFDGINARGRRVGYTFLQLNNTYCP